MSHSVVVIGVIGLVVLPVVAIVGVVAMALRRHNRQRAAASLTVAASVPYELQLAGSTGTLYFRFRINEDIGARPIGKLGTVVDRSKDLLISREIVDDDGGTRAFAAKTAELSRIKGARSARWARTEVATGDSTGSIALAAVRSSDRVVRGVVLEHPKEKLLKGWVYVPRRW